MYQAIDIICPWTNAATDLAFFLSSTHASWFLREKVIVLILWNDVTR